MTLVSEIQTNPDRANMHSDWYYHKYPQAKLKLSEVVLIKNSHQVLVLKSTGTQDVLKQGDRVLASHRALG